jgi:hypothetical protein
MVTYLLERLDNCATAFVGVLQQPVAIDINAVLAMDILIAVHVLSPRVNTCFLLWLNEKPDFS